MAALVIRGVRLVDARSEAPLTGDTLTIGEDGRISALGAGTGVDDEVPVLDGARMTLVPGLIDCHVHLGAAHETVQDAIQRSLSESIGRMLGAGGGFLEAGVTT